MKKLGVFFLFMIFSTIEVHAAEEAVVIEVRKNVQMSKNDKVYKNYFINGGTLLGLKKGSMVDVLRRVPVHDPLKNTAIGDLHIKVAKLEIIHADPKISVARLVSVESPENRPLLEYEAVMVGDRLDLGTIQGAKVAAAEAAPALKDIPGDKVAALGDVPAGHVQKLVHEGDRMLASLDSQQMASKTAREPQAVKAKHGKAAKKKAKKKKKSKKKTP